MVFSIHYLLCFFQLILVQQFLANAQTGRNVSLGSSLTALDNNLSWPSPSGDFAFGFRPRGGDTFLLSIWFDKIPEKTIVWSANEGETVQRGSKIELTNTGKLVLTDPRGNEIWKKPENQSALSAAMLDTGNFVLTNGSSAYPWESFGGPRPSDTMLPTQTRNPGPLLVSHLTETNYTNGKFELWLLDDGALTFYLMAYPTTDRNDHYSETNPTSKEPNSQLVFDQPGSIYIARRANGTKIMDLSRQDDFPTSRFYHRATLDYDGVLRHYVHPRDAQTNSTGWSMRWFAPVNICQAARPLTGSGVCGYNSYCRQNESRPVCECPNGFSFLDPNNTYKGCKRDFDLQTCGQDLQENSRFNMIEVPNTDWISSDFEQFQNTNEENCTQACLSDCFCPVAVFQNGICSLKRFPLSNGRTDAASVGGKTLVKVGINNTNQDSCSKKKDWSDLVIIVSVLLGSSCFLNLVISLCIFGSFRKRSKKINRDQITPGVNLQQFTYKELENATNGFKEEVGSGAFATVYKGALGSDGKVLLAVKKLEQVSESGEEFRTEVNAIGRTNHKNLVQLLGFCNEGSHRLLVYEFMSNGSLASFLFATPRPNWFQRTQIALGIARGLKYLHEGCRIQTIHCDIKPQNILLDNSFNAKISDFGLAKLLKTDQSQTSTDIRGTKGYVAPEWFRGMGITTKVDVYSFGVILLEIICCRRNVESNNADDYTVILTEWAYDCYKDGRLDLLLESNEEAMGDMKKVEKLVMIAIWCIQEEPSLRPTMKKVTQMMEGDLHNIPTPPDPTSTISSISSI